MMGLPSGRPLVILATLATGGAVACAPKHVSAPAHPTAKALVVLLPDSDNGATGRIRVLNDSGSVELASERDATPAAGDRRPGPVYTMTEADVQRVFGSALAALPPAPRGFTLFFRFESDELTEESLALVPEILNTVKSLPVPEVAVVGHTDTMGTREANVELGMKRATMVRNLLVQAGLDPSLIDVSSHGEGNLLVRTPDETPEPRNRRVEIAVR